MSKITLTDLVNLENQTTAVNAINTNNSVIELAFDNTLSLDGTAPNQMQANFDMNSHRILNLPEPVSQSEPIRLQDITSLTTTGVVEIANNTVAGNFSGSTATPTGVAVTGTGSVALAISPAFTGTPTAPTATGGTNTTQIATTAFVANAVSGSSSPTITPQGRLSLVTGVPVMTSNQAGATTVYFMPYGGNYIPLYNGSSYTVTTFAELSQTTADATKSPAAVTLNSNYDMFVWNDSGTVRCTRGPAWSSGTTRGTGAGTTELQLVGGLYLNKVAITNGPAANRGTYVGTVRSNASSTIDWIFGTAGAGGVAGVFNVWNAYNRVMVGCTVIDTNAAYTYASGTPRQKDASTGNQISFLVGLAEDVVYVSNSDFITLAAVVGNWANSSIGLDSITASSVFAGFQNVAANTMFTCPSCQKTWYPGLGTHYVASIENSSGTNTFNAQGVNSTLGLTFTFPM